MRVTLRTPGMPDRLEHFDMDDSIKRATCIIRGTDVYIFNPHSLPYHLEYVYGESYKMSDPNG
jgi:hypothetical protein